jgi:hypothetical protein
VLYTRNRKVAFLSYAFYNVVVLEFGCSPLFG